MSHEKPTSTRNIPKPGLLNLTHHPYPPPPIHSSATPSPEKVKESLARAAVFPSIHRPPRKNRGWNNRRELWGRRVGRAEWRSHTLYIRQTHAPGSGRNIARHAPLSRRFFHSLSLSLSREREREGERLCVSFALYFERRREWVRWSDALATRRDSFDVGDVRLGGKHRLITRVRGGGLLFLLEGIGENHRLRNT